MQSYSTSEQYFCGISPLAWAAHNGYEEVVKIFLGREDVDESYRSPCYYAAAVRNEEVVKMPLWRAKVNLNLPDMFGRIPLWFAAEGGFGGVGQIHLGTI